MKARNLAAVGLSLMLAANCFMPCYTLAYADDLGEGSEIEFIDDLSSDIEPGADDSDFGGIEEAENSGSTADGADFGVAKTNQSEALNNEELTSSSEVIYSAPVKAAAVSTWQRMLNIALDSLASQVGANVANDIMTTNDGTNLARANMIMNADSRYLLARYLPSISSYTHGAWSSLGSLADSLMLSNGLIPDLLGKIQRNSDYITSNYGLLQKQWGYGYGGTIVIEKGSPMDLLGKVQRNSDYVTSLYGLIQKQWGYGFGGTVVTEKGSPFDLLGKIQRNSDYITSLDSRASIANDLLGKIQRNSDYITSLDSRVEIANDLLGKIQRNSDFITSLDSRVSIVNDLLGKIQRNSDFITSLDSRLERYYPAHSNLVGKGFSDVLDKLGSLSVSVEVDLSGVESRLDSIIRLLTFAGVVENAKDVLDAIFGDMTLDATQAASAAVGSAIQNAFPFCVPAVLKQILGLLQADPAPPEFHFDFWGAPLDFGFGDWGGLADMTGWLSRIGFAVMLFSNSRRFVFAGGVGGD